MWGLGFRVYASSGLGVCSLGFRKNGVLSCSRCSVVVTIARMISIHDTWSTLASRAEGKAFANSLGNSMLLNPKQLLARDDQRVPVHCNMP